MHGLHTFLVVFGAVVVCCLTAVWMGFRQRADPHAAPRRQMTVAEAHLIMQRHRGCSRDDCTGKQAAYRILVEAGRLQPDSGRIR
jgi:hypothetical protein